MIRMGEKVIMINKIQFTICTRETKEGTGGEIKRKEGREDREREGEGREQGRERARERG